MSLPEIELDLGPATITCTPDEFAAGLAALLREIRSVALRLRPDERVALRAIMSHGDGALTVGQVFHDFSRESEAHKTLRRLRAAQFVRPAEHGHWGPDEPIEVKPFARLLWDRLGEGEIFAAEQEDDADALFLDLAEPPAAAEEAVAEEAEREEAEPPRVVEELAVEEVRPAKTAKAAKPAPKLQPAEPEDLEAAAARLWEDDSVVDLADADDFRKYVEDEVRQNS
ncbi:MAG TPA: hypothetical protein VM529_01230 [Gemmata sp.]|nr:hypothetical protein [Gemmata sp.]